MDRDRRELDRLLHAALTGRLSRRQVLTRASALGLSGAAMATLGAGLGPVDAAAQGTPKTGGTLKVALQADPTALDPHKQSLTAIWHTVEHIYSRLTKIMPDLTVQPELAEKWDISADGKTYTFALRQGVKFHDGTPLKASDVKFSFERLKRPSSTSSADLESVATIEAPADNTVVLHLNKPDASLLATLGGQSCIVMSEAFVKAHNDDISQVAMGSGPFKFKEYVPNTRVSLVKNPDYFEEGKPYVDALELNIVPDDTARTTSVVSGAVDFIEYAPLRDIDTLKGKSDLTIAGDANTNIRFIGFNLRKEPFNNLKVRQAIAAVVDRDAVIASAVFGHGTPVEVIFPPSFWAALKKDITPPDVAKAKQLMKDAGYPNGFKTTMTSWSQYSFLSNAAVVVQEQLKQIGIQADMNLVENATMIQDVYTTYKFDLAVTGDSAYVDPNTLVLGNFKTGASGNFVGYSNPKVDQLIDQGIATTDQSKRTEIYQQIQQILLDDLPWVNLFVANQYEVMKSYVKGYTHIPTGTNYTLRETWLDK